MDSEIVEKALHQREVRLRARYAYEKRRLANDPEYKAKVQAKKQAKAVERYKNDPEYAAKVKQQQRERYARNKRNKDDIGGGDQQIDTTAFEYKE